MMIVRSTVLGVFHAIALSYFLWSAVAEGAPFFCACVLGLFGTLVSYLRFQQLAWHHSADNELAFWLVFASAAALVSLFASDASPLAYARVGYVGIIGAVGYVGIVVLEKSRNDRARLRSFRRSASRGLMELTEMKVAEARATVAEIDRLCEQLDAFAPSGHAFGVNAWFGRIARDENAVLARLTARSEDGRFESDALDYILTHCNLARVLRVCRRTRVRLLDALTAPDALASLSAASKAAVIDALLKVGLRAFGGAETLGARWAERVVLSLASHDELMRLRLLLDSSGDYHSLHRLLFREMGPPAADAATRAAQQAMLRHIRELCAAHLARRQTAPPAAAGRAATDWPRRRRLKCVADIDDTLMSSGGVFPAGVDKLYPKKALYPGILQLLRALHADAGSDGSGDLVLLSARPHVYKDVGEHSTYETFASLRRAGLLHATPTLLAGDLTSSMQIVTKASAPADAFEAVALKKLDNFAQYARLYPDFDVAFFGDSGQGDVRVAEMMLQEMPEQVRIALIHVVQPLEKACGWLAGRDNRAVWEALGVRFYYTAAGAARHLHLAGLLSLGSLRHVCEAAAVQLDALRPKLAASGQLEQCLDEFGDELCEANALLGEALAVPMLEPPQPAELTRRISLSAMTRASPVASPSPSRAMPA